MLINTVDYALHSFDLCTATDYTCVSYDELALPLPYPLPAAFYLHHGLRDLWIGPVHVRGRNTFLDNLAKSALKPKRRVARRAKALLKCRSSFLTFYELAPCGPPLYLTLSSLHGFSPQNTSITIHPIILPIGTEHFD